MNRRYRRLAAAFDKARNFSDRRRVFLKMGGLAVAALVAQASTCSSGTPLAVVQKIQVVLTGLSQLGPMLTGVLSGTSLAQFASYVADAQKAAASLIPALSSGAASGSWATMFMSAVSAALGVVAQLGFLAPPWGTIASAVVFLLPIVANMLGVSTPAMVSRVQWQRFASETEATAVILGH